MVIELSEAVELAVKHEADAKGVSPDAFVRDLIESRVMPEAKELTRKPLKSGYGMWAKYGIDLSAEEIDENRRDMFKNFGESY